MDYKILKPRIFLKSNLKKIEKLYKNIKKDIRKKPNREDIEYNILNYYEFESLNMIYVQKLLENNYELIKEEVLKEFEKIKKRITTKFKNPIIQRIVNQLDLLVNTQLSYIQEYSNLVVDLKLYLKYFKFESNKNKKIMNEAIIFYNTKIYLNFSKYIKQIIKEAQKTDRDVRMQVQNTIIEAVTLYAEGI